MTQASPTTDSRRDSEVIIVGGGDRDALVQRVAQLRDWAETHHAVPIADVAFTVNSDLSAGGNRLGLVSKSTTQLQSQLSQAVRAFENKNGGPINDVTGIYYTDRPLAQEGKLAFLFPGEGAQYLGMLGDLPECFPCVASVLDQSHDLLDHVQPRYDQPRYDQPRDDQPRYDLRDFLCRKPEDPDIRKEMKRELQKISTTMMAVLTANWALLEVLRSLQLQPDAAAGHSAGELAAVWSSGGVEDDEYRDLTRSVLALDSDVSDKEVGASLLAVGAGREPIAEILQESSLVNGPDGTLGAYLAMDNCPHQTVVVGLPVVIDRLQKELHGRRIICERLAVDRPYHTPLFEPYMLRFREMFSQVTFAVPDTTVYSCTTAAPFPADAARVEQLVVEHWASRVEFTRMIRRMHEDGIRVFIEAGPRGNLSAFVQDILRGESCLVLPANVQRHAASTQLNHMLAQLATHHIPFSVDALYANRPLNLIEDIELRGSAISTVAAHGNPKSEVREERSERSVGDAKGDDLTPRTPHPTANRIRGDESHATTPVALPSYPRRRQEVVLAHQQVMQQFLDVQRQVMQRYLITRGRSLAAAPSEAPVRFPDRLNQSASIGAGSVRETPREHARTRPLVGQILSHRPGEALVTRRRLDLREDRYAGEHTIGGREISRVNPQQVGLPVMPMTFTLETMAQNALHLFPGMCVRSIRGVRLQRWLAFYANDPCEIEVKCERIPPVDPAADGEVAVRVEVTDLGNADPRPEFAGGKAAIGEVVLGNGYQPAPVPKEISEPLKPCDVSVERTYENLFHGPMFQELRELDQFGETTIVGTIDVGSRGEAFTSRSDPEFVLDPIMLDVAMHNLAGWHLAMPDQSGRIMLPFELQSIEFHAPCPSAGDTFKIHGRLDRESARHFEHSVDIIGADGRVHARLSGAKFWRFYLPFHDVNFHGRKDVYYLSENWPSASFQVNENEDAVGTRSACIRLTPPADLMQPAMLSVAGRVILSDSEFRSFDQMESPAVDKGQFLFARGVAKDAVRRFWQDHNNQNTFAADIEIDLESDGEWIARRRGNGSGPDPPSLCVATAADGMAAMASDARVVGIGLQRISAESASVVAALAPSHQDLVARLHEDPIEGALKMLAASQAMDYASRRDSCQWDFVDVEPEQQLVKVRLDRHDESAATFVQVKTDRQEDWIAATVAWS